MGSSGGSLVRPKRLNFCSVGRRGVRNEVSRQQGIHITSTHTLLSQHIDWEEAQIPSEAKNCKGGSVLVPVGGMIREERKMGDRGFFRIPYGCRDCRAEKLECAYYERGRGRTA